MVDRIGESIGGRIGKGISQVERIRDRLARDVGIGPVLGAVGAGGGQGESVGLTEKLPINEHNSYGRGAEQQAAPEGEYSARTDEPGGWGLG